MKIHLIAFVVMLAFSVVASADLWLDSPSRGRRGRIEPSLLLLQVEWRINIAREVVWNGGAQNPPLVGDYFIDGSRILIRHSTGTRADVARLISGRAAKLEVTNEYKIIGKHAGPLFLVPNPDKHRNPIEKKKHNVKKMPSRVLICDRSKLERMHTGSLLARLRKLQQCEESLQQSDRDSIEDAPNLARTEHIEFKETSEWAEAYRDLKEILNNREHLPTASEREARRKDTGW